MLYKITSAALHGIEAYPVEVEVDICPGFPTFVTVGLPDAAVRESKERVRAALKNCGYDMESKRITVNLAPADRRKEGSAFDLPIALGFLAYLEVVPAARLREYLFVGELALDGRLKPVRGALPIALMARQAGFRGIVVPGANAREGPPSSARSRSMPSTTSCASSDCFASRGGRSLPLRRARAHRSGCLSGRFRGRQGPGARQAGPRSRRGGLSQRPPRRAPGAGKTMLARRLPTILPEMSYDEMIEVTRVYSAAGLLAGSGTIGTRPFRAPHHTVTDAGLIGGGIVPKPGEVSLAHHGLLFLDELPEFKRRVLEDLRQPVEDGRVTVARSGYSVVFPAAFMLVAAMNPCADVRRGLLGREVDCTEGEKARYYSKISGPLLDRIDIQLEVPEVKFRDIVSRTPAESSAAIRVRVTRAESLQTERFAGRRIFANAQMGPKEVKQFCSLPAEAESSWRWL